MARAEVREVITKFVAEDDFTIKVDGMTRSSKELADAAEKARRASGAVGGGRFGGMAGAMGVPAMSFQQFAGMHLAGMGQGAQAFAASGGILSDALTAPLRMASSIARLGGVIAFVAGGPIGMAIGAVGLLGSLFMDFANVPLAVVGKALETVGGIAIRVGGILVGALATGLTALFGMSVKTALAFDQLERSFGAFLGSQEKGKQAAAFVEQYGLVSAFEQTALQEAARSLLAVNLSLSQFLPVVEAIAMRRGVGSENMMEVARIMMEVAGGATGRAFGPMGLGRFGISRSLLEEHGAQFDKAGSFKGTPTEALQVLLRLGSSPQFQAIREAFETSPAVKFSNALDAINKALRDMGGQLLPRIVPLVERFADTILRGVNAGVFADAVERMADGFRVLAGGAVGAVKLQVEDVLATVAGFIAHLPDLAAVVGKTIMNIFDMIGGVIKSWLDFFKSIPGFGDFLDATIKGFSAGFQGAVSQAGGSDVVAQMMATIAEFRARLQSAPGLTDALDPSAENALRGQGAAGAGGSGALAPPSISALAPGDFRRFALGGGDVGRLGLTDVDMAKIGAFGSQQPTVKVRVQVVGVGNLEEFFRRLFEQFAREYEEQRVRVLRPSLG